MIKAYWMHVGVMLLLSLLFAGILLQGCGKRERNAMRHVRDYERMDRIHEALVNYAAANNGSMPTDLDLLVRSSTLDSEDTYCYSPEKGDSRFVYTQYANLVAKGERIVLAAPFSIPDKELGGSYRLVLTEGGFRKDMRESHYKKIEKRKKAKELAVSSHENQE
jgi:hypothetical protein